MSKIDTLFLDIGGVLLTNGWDHNFRNEAAKKFGYNAQDFEEKHKEYFDLFEKDKITLDEYLNRCLFSQPRNFTLEQFKNYMFENTRAYPDMIEMFKKLKKAHGIRIAAVSNEGRELAEYRISAFNLKSFVDDFFISSFVHYQKPETEIFQIALDVMQVRPENVIYIDDRKNLIEAGMKMGFYTIWHTSVENTKQELLTLLSEYSTKSYI